MSGLASVIFGLAAGFVQIGLLLFVIIAIVGGRGEEDPDGVRPASIYYHGAQFVSVFAVLFGAFATVVSLMNLTIDKTSGGGDFFGSTSNHDGDWSAAVRALIIVGVAVGLYLFHDRRRQTRRWGPPGVRVRKTYLYSVSFVAVLTATAATVLALFAVWDLIAPGVTNAGPRSESLVSLIDAAFLAVGAAFLVRWHLTEAEPSVAPAPPPPPPPPAPPPAPVVKKAAVKKAPVKKAPAKKAAARR